MPVGSSSMSASASKPTIGVVVLTFNSAGVIRKTLEAAARVSPAITCVDSGSTDGTVAILTSMGCRLLQRPFKHYADQRNWAIAQVESQFDWQLHLDADEVLDEPAIAGILNAVASPGTASSFLIRRKTYFMGQPLRFGGTMSWHLRLFRSGFAQCEDRLYDQHFVGSGVSGRINRGWLHDLNMGSLTEWIARHNRWSDLEAAEVSGLGAIASGKRLTGDLRGDARQRTRYCKGLYYRSPRLLRAVSYFLYRYILRGGFLDGRVGLIYSVLQALWFRTLVDAKLIELEQQSLSISSKKTSQGAL